jgi:hypothetical protein
VTLSSGFQDLVFDPASINSIPPVATATSAVWQVPLPDPEPSSFFPPDGSIPTEVAYRLLNWQVRDGNGNTYTAPSTEIDLTRLTSGQWSNTNWGKKNKDNPPTSTAGGGNFPAPEILHVAIPPSAVSVTTGPGGMPCMTEACNPSGGGIFAVAPPWLHANPELPGQAADSRVLALALAYAWAAGEQARSGPSTPAAVRSAQFDLANALYAAVFQSTFATVPVTTRYDLTAAVQKLMQALCCSLLYPGPKCTCEPHGVIIGCARVEGGRIVMVDPWGGRRWVVHYPLLAYWGQQFGIMPPDAIASKVFDIICCMASLPPPATSTGIFSAGSSAGGGRSAVVPLGASRLVFEPPETWAAWLKSHGVQPIRAQTILPGEFAVRLLSAIRQVASPATFSTSVGPPPQVDWVPLGFPEVHLLAPEGSPEPPPPQG